MRIRRVWVVFILVALFNIEGLIHAQGESLENEQDSYKKQIEKILNDFEKKIKELERKTSLERRGEGSPALSVKIYSLDLLSERVATFPRSSSFSGDPARGLPSPVLPGISGGRS